MNPKAHIDLQASVTNEFLALADLLDPLPDAQWDTPSLCAGWEVVPVVVEVEVAVPRLRPAGW